MELDKSAIAASLVRDLPLFSGFSEADVIKLLSVCEPQRFLDGQVVFTTGAESDTLRILIEGSLSVQVDPQEQPEVQELFVIHPPAPVGELSALTGEVRNVAVVAKDEAVLLAVPAATLEKFLKEHSHIGFELQRNLLRLASRKIGRDKRRLGEMRDNIVSTQKAMKRMRDAILESEDNPLHAALFEELDALIEQNRKIHYLVEPSRLVPTAVRLADGTECPVLGLSTEWLYIATPPESVKAECDVSGTLLLDGQELPMSGRVEKRDGVQAIVYLDDMIPAYEEQLNRHLARAQLLDMVM
jgi:CRP-like cAMP-binding protein